MGPTWPEIRAGLDARPPGRLTEPVRTRAAVALVLRDGADGIEALFIRRADHPRDPWSGQMAFPGGREEEGDIDLQATAVREMAEELGIDLSREAEYLGGLDEVRALARMRPLSLSITPFVFRLSGGFDPRLSEEVRSVHWLPLAQLLGPGLRSTMDYVQEGVSMQFPCLRFEELVIWGLTYRMFMSFQERFPPPAPAGIEGT